MLKYLWMYEHIKIMTENSRVGKLGVVAKLLKIVVYGQFLLNMELEQALVDIQKCLVLFHDYLGLNNKKLWAMAIKIRYKLSHWLFYGNSVRYSYSTRALL